MMRSIELADGSRWELAARGEYAAEVLERIGNLTRLRENGGYGQRILLVGDDVQRHHGRDRERIDTVFFRKSPESPETVVCQLRATAEERLIAFDVMQVLLVTARLAMEKGGFLLHGGLAVKDGRGIVLAGRSKAGKSTSSRRLPPPWESLSDDITLVVRDRAGRYFGHPWPTWGRVRSGEGAESWDLNRAVPLDGIFILEQARLDECRPLGPGKSLCLLNETADQAMWLLTDPADGRDSRGLRLRLFDNLAAAVQAVAGYHLRLTLHGRFWEEIESAMEAQREKSSCLKS